MGAPGNNIPELELRQLWATRPPAQLWATRPGNNIPELELRQLWATRLLIPPRNNPRLAPNNAARNLGHPASE